MVKVNIEIRLANHFDGAVSCEKTTKAQALIEYSEMAVTALEGHFPQIVNEPYCTVPSKEWKKLPKNIYKVQEDDDSPQALFIKVRREVNSPQGKICPIYLIFSIKSDIPSSEVNFFSRDEDAKAYLDSKS